MSAHALATYDAMMARYSPGREERFEVMVELVLALVGDDAVVLDAASGPGSFGARLLARAPAASVVAADADPAMLAIAREVATSCGGRMNVVELDLLDHRWPTVVESARFDAVVLASATHYLDDDDLADLYRRLVGILRPGGLLLNGDELDVPTWVAELSAAVEARRPDTGEAQWRDWWAARAADPVRTGHHQRSAEDHLGALVVAGFERCSVVWQRFDSHLLAARSRTSSTG